MQLWRGPSPYRGGGGEAGGLQLKLMAGVAGDCVRIVPISFKATVKPIQAVGQTQDFIRVGALVCSL